MEVGVTLGGFIEQTTDMGAGARAGDAKSRPTLHNDNDASQMKAAVCVRCPRSVLVSGLFCSVYSILLYSMLPICLFFPSLPG